VASSSACSTLVELNGGYAHSTTRGRGAVDFYGGVGNGGFQARTKFSSQVSQVGAGVHGYGLWGGDILSNRLKEAAFVRGGVDVLQVGVVEDHGSVGVFCPFLSTGVLVPNPGFTLGANVGYDWRLSSAKNDVWVGATLGLGAAAQAH